MAGPPCNATWMRKVWGGPCGSTTLKSNLADDARRRGLLPLDARAVGRIDEVPLHVGMSQARGLGHGGPVRIRRGGRHMAGAPLALSWNWGQTPLFMTNGTIHTRRNRRYLRGACFRDWSLGHAYGWPHNSPRFRSRGQNGGTRTAGRTRSYRTAQESMTCIAVVAVARRRRRRGRHGARRAARRWSPRRRRVRRRTTGGHRDHLDVLLDSVGQVQGRRRRRDVRAGTGGGARGVRRRRAESRGGDAIARHGALAVGGSAYSPQRGESATADHLQNPEWIL